MSDSTPNAGPYPGLDWGTRHARSLMAIASINDSNPVNVRPEGSVRDWLNFCLLPIALAFVPLAFEHSTRVVLSIAAGLTLSLVVLVIGG